MTGKELLKKLENLGYNKRSEIANMLGISEQNFNRKIDAKDIKVSFLLDIIKATNKSVYDFLDVDQIDKTTLSSNRTEQMTNDDKQLLIDFLKKENLELKNDIEKMKTFQKSTISNDKS